MRKIENALLLWYIATMNPSLTSNQGKKALQEMTDEEFQEVQDKYDAAHAVDIVPDGIRMPDAVVVTGKIVDLTQLLGDNEGATAVSIVTSSGKPMSFVCTNKQVGDSERKGFGLNVGGYAEFHLEERIAKKTQYTDTETGVVKYHEKSGFGFVSSKKITAEEFTLAGIAASTNPAVQNALLQIHLAKINAGAL